MEAVDNFIQIYSVTVQQKVNEIIISYLNDLISARSMFEK
jgi:hypothetical protein